MDFPVMKKADRENIFEVAQLLAQAPPDVMALGAWGFAAPDFAPQMFAQEGQPQFGVAGQPGPPDFADSPDWFGATLQRFATLHTGRSAA